MQSKKQLESELEAAQDEVKASAQLCEIYFTIAASAMGEFEVRRRRDEMIKKEIENRIQKKK